MTDGKIEETTEITETVIGNMEEEEIEVIIIGEVGIIIVIIVVRMESVMVIVTALRGNQEEGVGLVTEVDRPIEGEGEEAGAEESKASNELSNPSPTPTDWQFVDIPLNDNPRGD